MDTPSATVSYTHLVNYKGQEYHATLTMPDGALPPGNNYTYTVKVRNKVLEVSEATIAKSVSYTHLDVYKRQGPSCTAFAVACAAQIAETIRVR